MVVVVMVVVVVVDLAMVMVVYHFAENSKSNSLTCATNKPFF